MPEIQMEQGFTLVFYLLSHGKKIGLQHRSLIPNAGRIW